MIPHPAHNLSQRSCPVCLAKEARFLFRQTFSAFSEGGLMEGYDLMLCASCGAAFSDKIPEQAVFDQYYMEMSKYEQSERDGASNAVDAERFRRVADLLTPYIQSNEAVGDVGCATGALLAEFKRRGYGNLLGMDPSHACADAAKRLYGINVSAMPIGRLSEVTDRFDVLMLTGVLEHLRDVEVSLQSLVRLLKLGGRLYIEVPDASQYYNWFSAPFQFFSMEHVNFFSPRSLSNLMARHGMDAVFIKQIPSFLGPNAVEPAIKGLFQRVINSDTLPRFEYDTETEPALRAYIESSSQLETRISSAIAKLVETQVPLLVWGAGTHTLRLLETSALVRANIHAFIDSNPRYQGKTLCDVKILSPEQAATPEATVLISSHVAEKEIKRFIVEKLRWPNPVVCLYEHAPIEQPQ